MMADISINHDIESSRKLWYRTAVSTAVIAGTFSIIALGLFAFNFYQSSVVIPRQEEYLDKLKTELRNNPDNEQLISQIRQFDLQIRRNRIRRLDFSRMGSYLLFAGVVVFLVSMKWMATLKPSPVAPPEDERQKQLARAAKARWALAGGLVMLGVCVLLLTMIPTVDFGRAETSGPSYPSFEKINKNWPRFRGPGGLGVSAYTNVSSRWNGKTGEGILWKTKIPLTGNNSPIVWDNHVFLSGADENTRQVYCFDAASGKLLWQGDVSTVLQEGAEPLDVMEDTGLAAPTLATDGQRVYAIFPTGDIVCFSFEGKRLWTRNLGRPESMYGYASSLDTYQNLLLVQYDQADADAGKSKLIALDGYSGQTVWETKRPVANSWTSPILIKVGQQYQVITVSDPWVMGYDPSNGKELWRAKCVSGDLAPSPIYAGGLVIVIEPYATLTAIRPDGRGDVTDTHITWQVDTSAPDICSPVSDGENIFLLNTDGLLICHKVTDGTKLWEQELNDQFLASPSLVGNRLYLLSEKGVMFIAETAVEYEQIGANELNEDCHASPAFVDGRIYIRGVENLYCIGSKL